MFSWREKALHILLLIRRAVEFFSALQWVGWSKSIFTFGGIFGGAGAQVLEVVGDYKGTGKKE